MYKYLCFVVLGIIIFLLYNRKDSFSVGIPDQAIINRLFADINVFLDESNKNDSETFESIRTYLSGLSDDDFDRLITSLDTPEKKLQYFLDCRRYKSLKLLRGVPRNYGIKDLYSYYTNTTLTKEDLEDFGIIFSEIIWSSPNEQYLVYEQILNTELTPQQKIELTSRFAQSGNSKPDYAINKISNNTKIYYFFEVVDLYNRGHIYEKIFLRGRIHLEKTDLLMLTIFPIGYSLGNHFFSILANNNLVIENISLFNPGSKVSYRRLYHLSVTLKTEGGFSVNGNFTIFRPDIDTARRLYGDLYDQLDSIPLTEWDHNKKTLFLMSIDVDDMQEIIEMMEEDEENILEEYIEAEPDKIKEIIDKINTLNPSVECAAVDTD